MVKGVVRQSRIGSDVASVLPAVLQGSGGVTITRSGNVTTIGYNFDSTEIAAEISDLTDAFNNLQTTSILTYGAIADGDLAGNGTDNASMIQAAENYMASLGGGVLIFPAGVYVVGTFIRKRDKVRWLGVPGATVLIVASGVDTSVVRYDLITDVLSDLNVSGIIFDGNQANAPLVTAWSVFNVQGVTHGHISDCVFRNGSGYGYAAQGETLDDCQQNLLIERCEFSGNGIGVGGDTFDGFDMKYGVNVTLLTCNAHDNYDTGINPRGVNISLIDCECYNNGLGCQIQVFPGLPTVAQITGGSYHNNSIAGIKLAASTIVDDPPIKVEVHGAKVYANAAGYVITDAAAGTGNFAIIGGSVHENDSHGFAIDGTLETIEIVGTCIRDNGGSGIKLDAEATMLRLVGVVSTGNANYGLREDAVTTTVNAIGCDFSGNTQGNTGPSNNQGSGSVLIAADTVSGASVLDFVLAPYSSKYRCLKIILTNVQPSADGAALLMRTSTDGGNTFDSGASDYSWAWLQIYTDATVIYKDWNNADTSIQTGVAGIGNASNESSYIEITLPSFTSAALYKLIQMEGIGLDTGSLPFRFIGSGVRAAAADVDAVEFLMDSGTFSADYALYGVS